MDCDEVWVFEIVGKYWVVEKVIEGVRCICNWFLFIIKMDVEYLEFRSYV